MKESPQPDERIIRSNSVSGDDRARPVLQEVTVIVPTVGRPVLQHVLESIAAGSHWPSRLVIVDQSQEDMVADLAGRVGSLGMPIDHFRAPRRGVAAGRNRGLERVLTRCLVINDDDQVVDRDWLWRMWARLKSQPNAVITGMVAPGAPGVPSSTTDLVPAIHTRPMLHRDPLFAGNMGTTTTVVEKVGLFDERAPLNGAEDNDWGYRALRHGIPIVYAPEVKVTHLDWRDEAGVAATHQQYARAQGAFYGKHLRHGDAYIACRAARDLLRGPWLVLRAFISQNPQLRMLGRAELAGILPGLVAGLRMPHLSAQR